MTGRGFVSHENRPLTAGGRLTTWLKKGLDLVRGRRGLAEAPTLDSETFLYRRSRALRHRSLDVAALRRRRAKNKVARRSRRINRLAVGR